MGIKNRIHSGYLFYLTLTVTDRVDIFTRPVYKNILLDGIRYCQQEKGLELYAWCLMSNHLHLIASGKDEYNLPWVLRELKKFTGRALLKAIEEVPETRRDWLLDRFSFTDPHDLETKQYRFWQETHEAKEIYTSAFVDQKLDFIHQNPVRDQIVTEPAHYLFSSARDYAGEKGLLDILLIN